MLSLCSIASGSSGNCIYISSENTHILVDAGISAKRIEEGLCALGVLPDTISAVLVTHEHTDHVQGLAVFGKKYGIPVYATAGTVEKYMASLKRECNLTAYLHEVEYETDFQIGDIHIHPFAISHDAVKPVSYTFSCGGHKIGMATDLGIYSDDVLRALARSEILYLEANHDKNMLMVGNYPYALKLRVAGEFGHLSNDAAAEVIVRLLHDDMKHIVLGHLSKENNFPELAYETVHQALLSGWNRDLPMPAVHVANRDKISECFKI